MSESHQRREAAETSLVEFNKVAERIESEIRSLTSLSSEDLRRELQSAALGVAQQLLRLAAIIRVLEERGEDLSDVKVGMVRYLRRIAYGQVLPEIVTTYADYPLLLNRLTTLPLPDQERIAKGESLAVMIQTASGPDTRLVAPMNMTAEQVYQVFGDGRVRSDAEQASYLDSRSSRPTKIAIKRKSARADHNRGGLVIGRSFVSLPDVLDAIAELRAVPGELDSEDDDNGEERGVPIKLTLSEHRRLRMLAAKHDTSMTELIRRALLAAGLI